MRGMNKTYPKKQLVMGVAAALAMVASSAVLAADEKYSLDIKAQGASSALLELSRKSGSLIIVQPDVQKNIQLKKLQGDMTLEEALNALLQDSGLVYEFSSDGSVVVSNSDSNDGSAEDDVDEEVVVTGSRIRGVETAAPTVSITREDIERRGFSSVEDIIRSLPQNYSGLNSSSHADGSTESPRFVNGASSANLRGLGTGSTLVLVDGRRSANAPSEDGTFIDLSKYPIGMIERIDVTTGGASAVYGSDAVGGVINIITRKDYQGAETTLRYESSNGDAYELRQMFGTTWDSGNVTVNLNYKSSDPVNRLSLGIENTDHSDRGGRDHRTRGISGVLDTRGGHSIPGAPAGTRYAILPEGDGTNVQESDLIYVSSLENATQTGNYLLMPLADIGLQNWLTSEQEDKSFNLTANQELTDSVQLYVDARLFQA